ncbi:O-antigen ligase family protein [Clostridium sp. AL.422]|uniref:O-antigen ligase family protein n=1 Tax=Clostridium TaxID=1485 RepID=UPI00293E004C|nr:MULTISPECIES: O-antigen ligase family protein [unclassified Clostridium]MDV4150322.1 O-antigen ligase family protein [Clostridium sp. AL.422]
MFEIIIGILPFIVLTSVFKENLGSLILFLMGSIFIIKNKSKIKESKYFLILIIMWLSIFISQIIVSPYIESISGSFLYLTMAIYYLIYSYVFIEKNKDEILKYILLSMSAICIFYICYHGLYQGIRVFGNIGYANSYGVLLLIGLYLNKVRNNDNFTDTIEIILFIGLLFTGSRTTIILSPLYIVYKMYRDKKYNNMKLILSLEPIALGVVLYIILDKLRLTAIFILPIVVIFYILIKNYKHKDKLYYILGILGVIILFVTNSSTFNRLKSISFTDGTFQERFVYYGDSVSSIIKHPFGNGINMFQYKLFDNATAFYDVKYIHNSFLQIAYDTGIINLIIFITIILIGLFKLIKSKNQSKNYLILAYLTILLHSLLDFDLAFSTFPIILVMLIVLGEVESLEKKKINQEDSKDKAISISKYLYIGISAVAIYFIVFETSIVIGNYLIDVNTNLADKIFSFSNNISFKRDYRGYFNRAQAKKNLYDKTNDNNYLKEGIGLLEISKKINPHDPMVEWNLSYLHESLGQYAAALKYAENVVERERFYPGAYIKLYDYLMKLYGETGDKNTEYKLKNLEVTYYVNYEELNKRAQYMNNQLQENIDDIRSENIDYNLLLNGKYQKEVKYFNQEDEKWTNYPYKTVDNSLGKTGCGVTAMAMIQSTIKEVDINPIELAKYSIENEYCNNNTEIEFFDEVVKEPQYKLNVQKFERNELTKIKRLVSDGQHMVVALMRTGSFTTEGHYLVLYGIETINGVNYFNVLDSNKDNKNYKDNENIIHNTPKDGFIKVKSSLFLEEAIEYWVYN